MAGLLGLRGTSSSANSCEQSKGRSGRGDVWVHGLWVCIGPANGGGCAQGTKVISSWVATTRGVVCGVQQSAVKTGKTTLKETGGKTGSVGVIATGGQGLMSTLCELCD
jgi:hypothetical protein